MSKNILAIYPHPDDETIIGALNFEKTCQSR